MSSSSASRTRSGDAGSTPIIEPADPAAPPATDEVIAYAKSRLAPYKVPKTVEIVEVIPRSEATKVNRRAMIDARGG